MEVDFRKTVLSDKYHMDEDIEITDLAGGRRHHLTDTRNMVKVIFSVISKTFTELA
jgi:hypothetical protein